MRYIIVPLCEKPGDVEEMLTAFPAEEKEKTGIVIPSSDPDPKGLQQGINGVCWKYQACFTDSQSADIVGALLNQLRSDIDPSGNESFTVNLIVDAAHAQMGEAVLSLLSQAGKWYRIHVIFLSACDSSFGREQSEFYQKIRSDAGGIERNSGLGWFWFTLLADENKNGLTGEMVLSQRKELLPYVLHADHSSDRPHTCYTYAISSEKINFDQIPEIPGVLALKYACETLQARDIYQELAILLMNGDVCPAETDAQAETFKRNLLQHTGFKPITESDLLVQKHDPLGDYQTRELMDLLLADNPDYDTRKYDQAITEKQLNTIPWVVSAVSAWERYVLDQTVRHTDVSRIRNQLTNESDWSEKMKNGYVRSYYRIDPLSVCTSRISGKKGFSSEAANEARDDLARVNEGLKNAVFQAALRLIAFRLHHTMEALDQMTEARNRAVEVIRKETLCFDTAIQMMPGWCRSITKQFSAIASSVPMNLEENSDPLQMIRDYAQLLLNQLKGQADPSDGYLEMAASDNVTALKRKIQNSAEPCPLANPRFSGGSCIRKDTVWYMYEKMYRELGAEDVLPTESPVIACVTSFYLYPAAETAPDPDKEDFTKVLFRKKINLNIQWENPAGKQENKQWKDPENIHSDVSVQKPAASSGPMCFQWEYDQADAVNIRYMTIDNELIEEVKRNKQSFGGKFEIVPVRTLPSGVRMNIEILFLRYDHEIGRYSRTFYYETAKQRLEISVEYTDLKAGMFKKIRCRRFRAHNADAERLQGCVCVRNEMSGCICKHIVWQQDRRDCISGVLPEDGSWSVINRPDSPYVYQLEE